VLVQLGDEAAPRRLGVLRAVHGQWEADVLDVAAQVAGDVVDRHAELVRDRRVGSARDGTGSARGKGHIAIFAGVGVEAKRARRLIRRRTVRSAENARNGRRAGGHAVA